MLFTVEHIIFLILCRKQPPVFHRLPILLQLYNTHMQKISVEKFPLRNIIDAVIIPVIIFSYGKQRRIGRLAFLKGLREIQDSITAAQLTIPVIALAYHLIIVIS